MSLSLKKEINKKCIKMNDCVTTILLKNKVIKSIFRQYFHVMTKLAQNYVIFLFISY